MGFVGELRPFQVEAVERILERKSLVVAYEMGLGKQQPVDEPVLTPSGWTTMGSLRPGDLVVGGDGRPVEVVSVHPQGVQPVMRVTFRDGTWTRCGSEHLWAAQSTSDKFRQHPWREVATAALRPGWHVPVVGVVQHDARSLPVDPYVLGVLLGDGSVGCPHLSFSTDRWVADHCGWSRYRSHETSPYTVEGTISINDPLVGELRALGLWGKRSWEKFVPDDYLLGSPEDRLGLLRGLLDTDGHPMEAGGVEFSSTAEALVRAVASLTRSLGGIARNVTSRTTTYPYKGGKKSGRLSWRVNVKLPADLCPFLLPRKADAWVPPTKYPPAKIVAAVEPEGVDVEQVCIRVANPDGLYVTRDYIVTHNTVLSIASCEHLLENEIVREGLVVVPAALKYQWAKSIKQFTDGALVLVIDGPPKKREKQYAEADRYEYVILNYEQVVNDWRHVRNLGRGFVVLDEATAIKSPTAARTKAVHKLTTDYRIALTGQPVENRPEEIYSLMEWVDHTVLGRFDIFDRTFIKRDHWGNVERYTNLPLLHELLSGAMVRKTKEDPDVAPFMPDVVEEVIYVDFDAKTKKIYDHIASDLNVALASVNHMGSWDVAAHYGKADNSTDLGPLGDVMARFVALTMACVNPHLLVESAENYNATKDKTPSQQTGSKYAAQLLEDGALADLPTKPPKITEVVNLVKQIVSESPKNKVVVFSFFRGQLTALEAALATAGVKSVQFHGGMNAKAKDAAKTRFQLDSSIKVFLSSDAGGYGVDLPQANYLINVDLPWSAGKWDQRNARIIRLASEWKSVTLLHMLMRGSVDERQYEMLEAKKLIATAVVDGKGADSFGHLDVDLDTLTEFLNK